MVYLEMISDRDEKVVSRNAWAREKQIKKWSPDRKRKMIRLRQEKSVELIHKFIG